MTNDLTWPTWRWERGAGLREEPDRLAREEPLEIRVRGRALAVTMRTPGHDGELAVGFLLAEGIVAGPNDVLRVEHCARHEEDNVLDVILAPDVRVDFERLTRHVFASSSCGLCGKATIESVHQHFAPIASPPPVRAEIVQGLPRRLAEAQPGFARTGGVHAAALFDLDGSLLVAREDVGRHNAVDKVLGWAVTAARVPLDRHVLLVSGRASFEIMQKALAGRVGIVAAVSAPTSLAAAFAGESGQTLIGFLRDDRMNVYTNPERVTG